MKEIDLSGLGVLVNGTCPVSSTTALLQLIRALALREAGRLATCRFLASLVASVFWKSKSPVPPTAVPSQAEAQTAK
jgi:hypothetical protein